MKTLINLLLAFVSGVALAAPSTDLGTELSVPIESGKSIALVDRATGQIRVISVNGAGNLSSSAPAQTELPDITGVTSGLQDGGSEHLVLASASANRIATFNLDTLSATPHFPREIGPSSLALIQQSGASPLHLLLQNIYTAGGDSFSLQRQDADESDHLDTLNTSRAHASLQPFYETPVGPRYAVTVRDDGASARLATLTSSDSDTVRLTLYGTVRPDSVVASNIRREDNLLMLATYQRGENEILLVPASTPPTLGPPLAVGLAKPVHHLSAAPTGSGPAGMLVTYTDGTAAHVVITTAYTLKIIQNFTSPDNDSIRSLLAFPGLGVLALTGDASTSSGSHFYAWSGTSWDLADSLALPALGNPDNAEPDFATLFWFNAEPLVAPGAQLVAMESLPDWTSKPSAVPIPANVLTESYLGPTSGLDNPTASATTAPPGAAFLLTNQNSDNSSLTAYASQLALRLPSLELTPDSGSYPGPVLLTASIGDDLHQVFYRENSPAAVWQTYTDPLTIAYPSTWQLYARDPSSGINSPVFTRSYQFDTAELAGFDSDGDTVPDFVEREAGLDPQGGADSDADGYTDLDELLNGSDPVDENSKPGFSTSPFNGEGFLILAQARDASGSQASDHLPGDLRDGEIITLRGMTSNLLGTGPVAPLSTPTSLAGQLAATLKAGTAVPAHEWLVLNSPQYFDLDGPDPQTRGGREVYRVLQRPQQSPPVIAPVLSGTDRFADAAAWLAATAAAYAGYEQVSSITTLEPTDTALAVVAETALFNALGNLDAANRSALEVPASASGFTLFGQRDDDILRTSLSLAMRDALMSDGLSLPELLNQLDNALSGNVAVQTLSANLYNYHVAHSQPTGAPADIIPLLPLPLDALRELVQGGPLPAGYSGAATASTVASARAAFANALAQVPAAYRPTATWTVDVQAPVLNGQAYSYINLGSGNPVAFFELDGDPLSLDQGLGLAVGTRFSVTGYTDVTAPAGHEGMELVSLNVISIPAASDRDQNGNLLGDEWEAFFFGELGTVAPQDTHPVNGYTYLQLYLIGHDPRDTSTDIPAAAFVNLAPVELDLSSLLSGNFGVEFEFPADYIQYFDFSIQQSSDLPGIPFTNVNHGPLTSTGPGQWQVDLGINASTVDRNFFRLVVSLAN